MKRKRKEKLSGLGAIILAFLVALILAYLIITPDEMIENNQVNFERRYNR
jgi:hypothetical protein